MYFPVGDIEGGIKRMSVGGMVTPAKAEEMGSEVNRLARG